MIGSANAITPSNSPERRERYLDVPYPRLDRAHDHSGLVRVCSIATMVTVSSGRVGGPGGRGDMGALHRQQKGVVHFEPCCNPGGFADVFGQWPA
jgi:hypothetical protein